MEKFRSRYPWLKELQKTITPQKQQLLSKMASIGGAPLSVRSGFNPAPSQGQLEFTGAGEDGVVQPSMPTEMVQTGRGPRMIHEGEAKIQNPDGSVSVIPQHILKQIEQGGGSQGMRGGGCIQGYRQGGNYLPAALGTQRHFAPSVSSPAGIPGFQNGGVYDNNNQFDLYGSQNQGTQATPLPSPGSANRVVNTTNPVQTVPDAGPLGENLYEAVNASQAGANVTPGIMPTRQTTQNAPVGSPTQFGVAQPITQQVTNTPVGSPTQFGVAQPITQQAAPPPPPTAFGTSQVSPVAQPTTQQSLQAPVAAPNTGVQSGVKLDPIQRTQGFIKPGTLDWMRTMKAKGMSWEQISQQMIGTGALQQLLNDAVDPNSGQPNITYADVQQMYEGLGTGDVRLETQADVMKRLAEEGDPGAGYGGPGQLGSGGPGAGASGDGVGDEADQARDTGLGLLRDVATGRDQFSENLRKEVSNQYAGMSAARQAAISQRAAQLGQSPIEYLTEQAMGQRQLGAERAQAESAIRSQQAAQAASAAGQLAGAELQERSFEESVRQFDVGSDQWNQAFDEQRRQFDVGSEQWTQSFNEQRRQFDTSTEEGRRQFNESIGLQRQQFNEGIRQWNEGFEEQRRQFDVGSDQWQQSMDEQIRQFNENLSTSDKHFFARLNQDQQRLEIDRAVANSNISLNEAQIRRYENTADNEAYWNASERLATVAQTRLDLTPEQAYALPEMKDWYTARFGAAPDLNSQAYQEWAANEWQAATDNRLTNPFDATLYSINSSNLPPETKAFYNQMMTDPEMVAQIAGVDVNVTQDADGNSIVQISPKVVPIQQVDATTLVGGADPNSAANAEFNRVLNEAPDWSGENILNKKFGFGRVREFTSVPEGYFNFRGTLYRSNNDLQEDRSTGANDQFFTAVDVNTGQTVTIRTEYKDDKVGTNIGGTWYDT